MNELRKNADQAKDSARDQANTLHFFERSEESLYLDTINMNLLSPCAL